MARASVVLAHLNELRWPDAHRKLCRYLRRTVWLAERSKNGTPNYALTMAMAVGFAAIIILARVPRRE